MLTSSSQANLPTISNVDGTANQFFPCCFCWIGWHGCPNDTRCSHPWKILRARDFASARACRNAPAVGGMLTNVVTIVLVIAIMLAIALDLRCEYIAPLSAADIC